MMNNKRKNMRRLGVVGISNRAITTLETMASGTLSRRSSINIFFLDRIVRDVQNGEPAGRWQGELSRSGEPAKSSTGR